MTWHRAFNVFLALVLIYLLGILGPRLDETACLIGGFGFIDFGSDVDDTVTWAERMFFWFAVAAMLLCTVALIFMDLGYVLSRMGVL